MRMTHKPTGKDVEVYPSVVGDVYMYKNATTGEVYAWDELSNALVVNTKSAVDSHAVQALSLQVKIGVTATTVSKI